MKKEEVIDEDIHQIIELVNYKPNLSELEPNQKAQLYSCNIEITPINIMNLKYSQVTALVQKLFTSKALYAMVLTMSLF
jgi:hypothetical protein